MAFRISNRMIYSDDLEIDVVDHCNLACRSCSHLSPLAPKAFASVEDLQRDLSTLATAFHARRFKLLGGEPLLHPQLAEMAQVVRSSGIADKTVLMTNGVLLNRTSARLWELIDCVEIYSYPSRVLSAADVHKLRELGCKSHTEVTIQPTTIFRESYSELPFKDESLVRRIYTTCEMAHKWGCYAIRNGYFYKCPLAHALPARLTCRGKWDATDDGVALDDPATLFDRLSIYLSDPNPLRACHHCLGTVGRMFPHTEITRPEWRNPQQRRPEDLVDRGAVFRLEHPLIGRIGAFLYHVLHASNEPWVKREANLSSHWRAAIASVEGLGLSKTVVLSAFMIVRAASRFSRKALELRRTRA